MGNRSRTKKQIPWYVLLTVATTLATFTMSQASAGVGTPDLPDWLEPRGLSIVELVGQVPESYLKDLILSYGDGNGIVVYRSGTRTGNSVTVTTTIYPRFRTPTWARDHKLTSFGCLGQRPYYDHMGAMVPASTLRVYDSNGVDVTQKIEFMYIYSMGIRQPAANSTSYDRYPPWYDYGPGRTYPLPPIVPGLGLPIPANSGCNLEMPGENYATLTGVFTLTLDPLVQATVVGSQSAKSRSYIGPGSAGIFQPLMDQLRARYPSRETRIPLSIPAGADYMLLKFPPMPGDPFADQKTGPPYYNAARPTGGTYRLARGALSADLIFSAVFPLSVAWQDADLSRGKAFLPVITSPSELAAPEYVLPAGIPYRDCYTYGCSDQVLQEIYEKEMTLQIIYLSVNKPQTGGDWTSLRMAGPSWSPSASEAPADTRAPSQPPASSASALAHASGTSTATYWVFLPYVAMDLYGEEPTGCPCGWFDTLGRMLDYAPGP